MTKLNIGDLQRLYQESDHIDKYIYAEQRSSILLVAGEHYNKRTQRYFSQIRDNRDLTDYQKLRLTKNYTRKAHNRYLSSIMMYASGIKITPQDDAEMQDVKDAELNESVWQDVKYRYKMRSRMRNWCSDFISIGECIACIKFDETAGEFEGYEPLMNEYGEPYIDQDGTPVPDKKKPRFMGDWIFDRVFGFNFMRDPGAKSYEDSPYIIVRKMVNTKALRRKWADHPEVLKGIEDNATEEYVIFDATRGGYERIGGQTMLREYYFRPSLEYPRGYYFIATPSVILAEGELPFGIWPIIYKPFDEHPASPRGRSLIKQVRPYQAEINRASSQQALHQITIGDDKLIYSAGTKLSPGALLPGVRGISYQGAQPQILPGRDGGQYRGYIDGQINELKDIIDFPDIEQSSTGEGGTGDMWAMLFKSSMQRQHLSLYSEKFEEFQIEFVETFLKLAKEYYRYYPDRLIPMIGKREQVNLQEFFKTVPMHYRVHVVPQDNTTETQFGKQLTMQHLLQYTGNNLAREDIGMLAREMPFGNTEQAFSDMTVDYDTFKNMVLSLERGEMPHSTADDNHDYILKKLSARRKQSDFRFLPQQVQEAYALKIQEHNYYKVEKDRALAAAKNEFVPTEGALIAVDMYVPSPNDPTKTRRARIPQTALDWLFQKLQDQTGSLERLEEMSGGLLDQYGEMMSGGGQAGQISMNPKLGQARPTQNQ